MQEGGVLICFSLCFLQASTLCTYIAKGNVALSILFTTATTIGAIFMTPLLCKILLGTVVPVDAYGIAVSTIQVLAYAPRVRKYVYPLAYPICRSQQLVLSATASRATVPRFCLCT